MADDVRRSGRANKGHHTKNADALDEPVQPAQKPKLKPKGGKKQTEKTESTRSPSEESDGSEEEDAIIRCVCGDQRDIRGRQMICCDECEVWQHNRCLNLPEGDYWENRTYYCERCRPDQHVELLAAMGRGEKPWTRKKGQKPPKSRPSDVKAETPQLDNTPTPQPGQAGASPAESSQPNAPGAVSKDASQNISNGQNEAKSIKRETPKSQPQSPLGEKRRHDTGADKESTNKKRKKSNAPQVDHADRSGSQSAVAPTIDALPAKRKSFAEKLRDTLAELIKKAVDSRGGHMPEGETAISLAIHFALQIDHASFLQHGEPTGSESPFAMHLRSIMFNVKKNAILIDRLLSGSLTAEEFASMAPEEMASEEKQRQYAAMREANEKQMVLTEETGPRLRKTHKGEEIVGEDDMAINDDFRPPPPRDRESISEDIAQQPPSPSGDRRTAVELPEDVGRRAPLAVDTSSTPTDGVRRTSTTFDINSVFDKVRSPSNDQQAFLQRRQSSIRVQERPSQGHVVDADVDRLLKDEDNDVEMSGFTDETIVWQGTINMQQLEPFESVARFVAGGDFGLVMPWKELLSSTLPIQGRIESQKGDEYIRGLASSGSHDVCVLALTPVSQEGRTNMDNLYNYFRPRDRWGVVPVDKLGNDAMRDLYVIPIEAGGSNLPPFLDMLEYCTIETPRKEALMLLALIAKLPETKPPQAQMQSLEGYPAQTTPQAAQQLPPTNGPTNGSGHSHLTNPHGPQYSPVSAAFPPGQNYNNYPPQPHNNGHAQQSPMPNHPPQHPNPKAVEILGPYISAPVIVNMLQSVNMTEIQMINLRHIMERVPEARNDLSVLSQHLSAANGQN